MQLAGFPTLFLAVAIASPALWSAFVTGDLDRTTALTRLLIAVPVAAVMLALVRSVTSGYGRNASNPMNSAAQAKAAVQAQAVAGEPVQARAQQRRTGDGTQAGGPS